MKKVIYFALTGVVLTFACEDRRNTVPPEEAAQKFVDDLGLKIQGKPNCAQIDSDNDGYVTCTIALQAKEGANPETMSLQCAGITSTDGCNAQTTKYVVGCKKTEPKVITKTE